MKREKILIVDDEEVNLEVFKALLANSPYELFFARDGKEGIEKAEEVKPDLILLDLMMPRIDGYGVLQSVRENPKLKNTPIIMITALNDRNSRIKALELGADDFLNKPIDTMEVTIRVKNLIRLKAYNDMLENNNLILEKKVKKRTMDLRNSYIEAVNALCSAAEYKDEETGFHIQRISHYSKLLAEKLGCEKEFGELLFYGSPMHDIGKIGIPDAVLLKPGPLNAAEWVIMKTHTSIGYNMLKESTSPYLVIGAEISLYHHEKWNGKGYPNGLSGEDIPLSARIMSICDQYDALRSKRPYKQAFGHSKTMEIIQKGDGRTFPEDFDPQIFAAFVKSATDFEAIYEEYKD
ncbi:MAG: HD domain-containing phosphohydrolase [Spirochaetota bacterium]